MTQRDWQKDMEMAHKARYEYDVSHLNNVLDSLFYWLQEAKELQEIVSGRGRELLRHRDLLKGLNDDLTVTEARADAAELRIAILEGAILSAHSSLTWCNTDKQIPHAIWHLEQVLPNMKAAPTPEITARTIEEWHEEIGDVLWWMFPIQEPPYCGNPLDSDWLDCYTHWTPFECPDAPAPKEGEAK